LILLPVLPTQLGWQVSTTMSGLFVDMGRHNILPMLTLNHDPLDLHLLSNCDYRCEPPCPVTKISKMKR
jgi:hypothetical protein